MPPAVTSSRRGKCFACLCEDVTAKDIHLSVEEGYDSIELSKRYTTTTMGPCQGRMCQLPAVRLMAEETGQSLADGGHHHRPAALARGADGRAGRAPVRARQALVDARPPPRARARTSCGRATGGAPTTTATRAPRRWPCTRPPGLIDVSTLGKLIVRGPDAGEFLDRLYPNRFSNLKPGRIRYGVIASDAGRIMDDGTICRLDDDSFYVTTTSSGAGAVYEWFSWWLADWRLRVHLTDVTQGLSAVNLAGPRAREILASLTELDCSRRGLRLPRREARRGGRGALPAPAHRLRGRGGLRAALPGRARRAPLGRAARGGRAARAAPVRARAAAAAAPPEDAHPRGPGHRLGVHSVRGRHALDREARQGPGLHRQVGARAGGGRRTWRRRSWASRWPTATCRPRARWCSPTATVRSGRSRARASRRSSAA